MTSSGLWACDTSVAVAAIDPNHEAHEVCRRVLVDRRPVLAGHAAVETYAVLTRLPPPLRVDPTTACTLLRSAFGDPCWPKADVLRDLVGALAERGVVGGAAYDAVVALAADGSDRTLLTRDRRAERTYQAMAVRYELI